MICTNCGAEMRFKRNGHSICWMCDNCGDAVASTYFEPCETDLTEYHILLTYPFKATINELKMIAEIASCNYIEAKKMIDQAPVEIFHGKAIEIKAMKARLKAAGIDFTIDPKFPY